MARFLYVAFTPSGPAERTQTVEGGLGKALRRAGRLAQATGPLSRRRGRR